MALIKSISGIRGTIGGTAGDNLTPLDIVKFSSAFGFWANKKTNLKTIVVGRDARVSGEIVSALVCSSLRSLGLNVIDLGLSTTPTVEMAVAMENAAGGIIITASHNPANWNALKLLNNKGEFISAADGEEVLSLSDSNTLVFAQSAHLGSYTTKDDYLQKHIEHILSLPLVDKALIQSKNFKIAVDGCNSTGGIAVPMLLKALGVELVDKFFCEADGIFLRNPEPVPENLNFICNRIATGNYHLGIVVDPDVDRLALICEDGTPFGEEYSLVSISDYVLSHTPGNTVSNLSSTRALQDVTLKHGGTYFASAVGEVNVVEKMKEVGAIIGGEGNGGIIYPALHYGRDALVGIALFLTQLAGFKGSVSMLRARYPSYYMSKNKIELTPNIDVDKVLQLIERQYSRQPINNTDGVRIDFDDEWVHLRRSNTEPIIRIYTESRSQATAEHLAKKIMQDIKDIIQN